VNRQKVIARRANTGGVAFFKAWAAYCGILVKLAPYGGRGELGTALFTYTINLYDLLEKYSWEGVKGYYFQFHRKRVASGKSIYTATDWQNLDSELIASKCFAHPNIRSTWPQGLNRTLPSTHRIAQLPLRGNPFPANYGHTAGMSHSQFPNYERRAITHSGHGSTGGPLPTTAPFTSNGETCWNWNFRECRTTHCRYQHLCASCGSNHRASQCPQDESALVISARNTFHKR